MANPTGYVTQRLLPKDGNGHPITQYWDGGTDELTGAQTYTADGVTIPNCYALQCTGAAACTGTYRANNESRVGVAQANTVDLAYSIPTGATVYGDFIRVTGAAGTLKLYKKLL
jgi:hypothetical protein